MASLTPGTMTGVAVHVWALLSELAHGDMIALPSSP
jgi:hypothetical protein